MCEYCGCRQVEPIADLMDEHMRLLEIVGDLRRALLEGDRVRAVAERTELVDLLSSHTSREEAGVFTALRAQGEYVDEVDALESEHVSLDQAVAALDLDSPTAEWDEALEQPETGAPPGLWLMNDRGVYLRSKPPQELADLLVPALEDPEHGLPPDVPRPVDRDYVASLVPLVQERLKVVGDAPAMLSFFFQDLLLVKVIPLLRQ